MPRKTIKISEETLITKLQQLRDELGYEPSITDIDICTYLPSARQLQRKYKSIADLRTKAGFTTTMLNKGSVRSERASQINKRTAKYEKEIINKLMKKYPNVIRHYAYQQWLEEEKMYNNIKSDAAVINDSHVVLIDFFYAKDMYSYGGCLRIKRIKLEKSPVSLYNCTHENIFVCVNPDITQDMIEADGTNKGGITVLSLDSFTKRFL